MAYSLYNMVFVETLIGHEVGLNLPNVCKHFFTGSSPSWFKALKSLTIHQWSEVHVTSFWKNPTWNDAGLKSSTEWAFLHTSSWKVRKGSQSVAHRYSRIIPLNTSMRNELLIWQVINETMTVIITFSNCVPSECITLLFRLNLEDFSSLVALDWSLKIEP